MKIATWTDWPLPFHLEPAQVEIQENLKEGEVKFEPQSINKALQTGKTLDGFSPTPISCDCSYFLQKQKPCKHIYALCEKLGIYNIKRRPERSETLCADFFSGYAAEWLFGVGKFHWSCLDIFVTEFRKKNKETGKTDVRKVPTQANDYRFDEGMVFYNYHPEIYAVGRKWADALNYVKLSLQIHRGNTNEVNYEYKNCYDNGVLKAWKVQVVNYGMVIFDVFIYKDKKPGKYQRYHARADELVKLLQYGHCICVRDGQEEILDLRKFL